MPSEKQNGSQLPDWFDVRKYGAGASFNARDWHWNILYRLQIRSLLDQLNAGTSAEECRFIDSSLQSLFESPVLIPPGPTIATYAPAPQADLVRDMSVSDVMTQAAELQKSDVYALAWDALQISLDSADGDEADRAARLSEDLDDSINDFVVQRWPRSSNLIYLEVDIDAPLDDLSKSFSEWILRAKEKRASMFAKKRSFTEADFKKWHRYRLIPYFDLMLWADYRKANIPVWLFVKALFQDYDGDVGGIFQKDTRPHVARVFSHECVSLLANQQEDAK